MEVQIEIGLPDEKGRMQILGIHSNKMKENSFLGADVDLESLGTYFVPSRYEGALLLIAFHLLNYLCDHLTTLLCVAARTQNFSGAELEGLVKSATSFALNRQDG